MYIPPNKYTNVAKRGDFTTFRRFFSVRRFLHPPSGRQGAKGGGGGIGAIEVAIWRWRRGLRDLQW